MQTPSTFEVAEKILGTQLKKTDIKDPNFTPRTYPERLFKLEHPVAVRAAVRQTMNGKGEDLYTRIEKINWSMNGSSAEDQT